MKKRYVMLVDIISNDPPELFLEGTLADGNLVDPYYSAFIGSGGVAPLTYSITAGSLPSGLELDSATGIISGTATSTGVFPLTVTVTDAVGQTVSVSDTFQVTSGPPLEITNSASDGTAQTLSNVPTTWDPTRAAASNVIFSNGNRGVRVTGGSWRPGAATIGKSSGKHTFRIQGSINDADIFFGLVGGTLGTFAFGYLGEAGGPWGPGLTANHSIGYWSAGPVYWNISGASSNTGATAYTADATSAVLECAVDLDSATNTCKFYKNGVLVHTRNLPSGVTWYPAWATGAVGAGNVITINAGQSAYTASAGAGYANGWFDQVLSGGAYTHTYTATGGTAPYTWSHVGGTLPTGASLSSAGVLSGTLTTPGTYNFIVRVTDDNGFTDDLADTVVVT